MIERAFFCNVSRFFSKFVFMSQSLKRGTILLLETGRIGGEKTERFYADLENEDIPW
jgi:hypothetical protein